MSTVKSAANKAIDSLTGEIDLRIAELRGFNAPKDSIEFYLLNNLVKYRESLLSAESSQEVDNAASIFGRFCTESMDWGTKDYQAYIDLSTQGHAAAKAFKTGAARSEYNLK